MWKSVSPRHVLWPALLLFKLQWLLLVLGRQHTLLWSLLLLFPLQLAWLALTTVRPGRALWQALLLALSGCALDQLLTAAGLFRFDSHLLPPWLSALWLAFALMLPTLMTALQALPRWQLNTAFAAAGMIGYGIGAWLGAVRFGLSPLLTLLIIGACWSLLCPLYQSLGRLSARFHRSPILALPLLCALALTTPKPALADDTPWMTLGHARFSVLLIPLYDATLQTASQPFRFPDTTPYALTLAYRRDIAAKRIVDATLDQWQSQHIAWSPAWRELLTRTMPDVKRGDRLRLEVHGSNDATLLHNDKRIATYTDADFITAFAGIWLDERTTHPAFRRQLLGESS